MHHVANISTANISSEVYTNRDFFAFSTQIGDNRSWPAPDDVVGRADDRTRVGRAVAS